MTTIYVFSDSHGSSEHILSALAEHLPDYVMHLGDGAYEPDEIRRIYPMLPLITVRGNCDRFSDSPVTECVTIDGKRIFLTHGHEHNVRYDRTLTSLRYAALEQSADVALFGHTHRPLVDEDRGLLIMNPGSCKDGSAPTFGILRIDAGVITAEISRC